MKLLLLIGPAGVDILAPQERVSSDTAFDAVNQLARLAIGGDEIIPASGGVKICRKAEDTIGKRIAAVMVEKKPAVEICGAKGFLDSGGFHLIGF